MVYSADGTVRVIVGSYDKSSFIRQLLKAGKLENDLLKDKNEKFIITTLHNLLKGLEGESCSLPEVTSAVLFRDCREMLKIVFDFPNELIDKVIEIS